MTSRTALLRGEPWRHDLRGQGSGRAAGRHTRRRSEGAPRDSQPGLERGAVPPDWGAVQLCVDASEDEVDVRVVDHGIGIPKADQLRLGPTAPRTQSTSRSRGTGLGLRMVQSSQQPPRQPLSGLGRGPGHHGHAAPACEWPVEGAADRGTDCRPPALRAMRHRLAPVRASVAHLDAGSGSRNLLMSCDPAAENPERNP